MRPTSLGADAGRKYLLAKSALENARKTVYERNWPAVRPTVCAVEAYERLVGERSVRAQPKGLVSLKC